LKAVEAKLAKARAEIIAIRKANQKVLDDHDLCQNSDHLTEGPARRTVLCFFVTEDDQMSFVSITTWRMIGETETLHHVTDLMVQKYFPGLLALGAKHSMLMDAELDRFAIVTVYPSRKVRDDAIAHISALRSEGAEEFGAELMDAYGGELLASSET
jgi:hypothetical protein